MNRFATRILVATLALQLLGTGSPIWAADSSGAGSMATSTLQGMTGALNDVNGMFSAFGQSSAQLQAMAAQIMQSQRQAQGVQAPQSQFDQIQQKLTLVMAEANACVAQASTNNYDKYTAKRSPKEKDIAKNISSDALTSVEPTCSTYGVILDAIELNKAKMADANKKMACLTNLQSKVNQIAEAAKAPFQQLKGAADEVYKTYSQIIDSHTQIASKIADQVDGPADKDGKRDGKGGYRAELGKLKGMALELNNVLNAKAGANNDGLKYGLVKQVKDLKQQRTSAANKWYFSLMQDVEYCYHNEPAPCFDNDVSMSPDQCLAAVVANTATGSGSTAGQRARAKTDAQGLQSIGLKNYVNASKINLPANIDVSKPDEFLSFTQVRFQLTLKGVLGAYSGHEFKSDVDKGKLVNYVRGAYQACYDKATANFKSDIISKGGRYYQDVSAVQDAERETANDEKNWIDRVEGEMTNFRTQFQKVYNSDLAQFKTDCTAGEDPYVGLDCLRVLDAELQSGLRGTRVSTKLSNGTNFTSLAGETSLPIQTLTLDAGGKPTIGNSSVQCSGFDDCINYLDRARESHASAAQKTTDDRAKFVEQHNAATKAAFQTVAGQFGQLSQLLTAGVTGVNQDLAKLGIKASIKTKQTEAEELKENEKTGLFDMPKSMKGALAGQNSYTEIDDDSAKNVTDAYNTMLSDLNKKAGDAQKQKRLCQVDNSSYKSLLGIMPSDCANTSQVCQRDRVASAAGSMEPIFKRSGEKIDENSSSTQRLTSNSDYKQCVSEIKAEANTALSDDDKLEQFAQEQTQSFSIYQKDKDGVLSVNPQKRAQAVRMLKAKNAAGIRQDVRQDCADFVLNSLGAMADADRASLRQQNADIVQGLKAVVNACSEVEYDEKGKMQNNEDVTTKCEEFKTLVRNAKAPANEGETGNLAGTSTGTSSDTSSNPFMAPAK